ncbi:Heat shock 70 kDa protein A [Trebouxia sp. C0009 RCD-2024]
MLPGIAAVYWLLSHSGGLETRTGSSNSVASAKEGAAVRQAEKKSAVDPIIQHLLKNARSEAVRQEFLSMPQGEYTSKHDVEVVVGTFNVNGRRPPADLDLRPWLDMANHQADIVAVGLQEVVPLNAGNVMMGGGLEAGSVWDMHIDRALNNPVSLPSKPGSVTPSEKSSASMGKLIPEDSADSEDDDTTTEEKPTAGSSMGSASASDPAHVVAANVFVQVAAKQMVGVYLSVWVRRGIIPHVRGVQVTSVGTGMMGYLGNKGAVAARLRVYDSGICFVCAHMASGENEGDELKRNYDYSEIVRRGQFPPDSASLDPETSFSAASDTLPQASADGRGPGQWGSQRGFLDNEHAIWMGDLNYRVTIPDEQARNLIRDAKLDKLLEADELVNMLREGRAFHGWVEGHIAFPPTFKFKRGTSQYLGADDEDESEQAERPSMAGSPDKPQNAPPKEKKRTPAWTDRILYKSPAGSAKQTRYSSANLLISDHKPVSSTLSLTVLEYVRDTVEAAVDTARRTVDAREMAAMPRCELEPTSAEIGEAFYGQEKKVHLILRNIGQVTANFQFMPLPGAMFGDDKDKNFRTAPRWASIEPEQASFLGSQTLPPRPPPYTPNHCPLKCYASPAPGQSLNTLVLITLV